MNRYLFKAKRKYPAKVQIVEENNWVKGAYYIEPYTDKSFIVQWNSTSLGFNEFIEVEPDTVCQCTGLQDKNGNLIWENDIVYYTDDIINKVKIDEIIWNETHAAFTRLHKGLMGSQYLYIN